MAAMTELSHESHAGGSRILGRTITGPHDNIPGKVQQVPQDGAPSWPSTARRRDKGETKLQALIYDILPSTAAVFSYAVGSRKLSANEQSFVGAQTVASL